MFIRRKQNKSGTQSVQIISKNRGKYKIIKTIGCKREEEELKQLEIQAKQYIEELSRQQSIFESSKDEAIELANNHIYGLGAAVFTQDIDKGEYIAKHLIESGIVQVNDFVRSDSRLPFGGIKQSGYGRELSDWGIREFVNVKTVSVR